MQINVISLEGIKPSGLWVKTCELIKFSFTNRIYTAIALIISISLMLYVGIKPSIFWTNLINEITNNVPGTIFNIITFIFIFALWVANIVKSWQDTLIKYLSVKFVCENAEKEVLAKLGDDYALLVSESDIRSLAQQIGMQRNNNIPLQLDSTKYEVKKTLSYDKNKRLTYSPFWHYEVNVTLRNPPKKERQLKSKEEYLDLINTNLKALLEKTEQEYESEFLLSMKKILADFIDKTQQTETKKP